MKKEKFLELWDTSVAEWQNNATVCYRNKNINVSEICSLKKEYGHKVYDMYDTIKNVSKRLYFGTTDARINRFKRAAVIVYAVSMMDPIEYKEGFCAEDVEVDKLLLKQRLAFHVGLYSIIMQYSKEIVEKQSEQGDLFDFSIESHGVGGEVSDTFLECVYKDIFYSEIYKNFNVLTMANVFLLITERSSRLSGLSKPSDH